MRLRLYSPLRKAGAAPKFCVNSRATTGEEEVGVDIIEMLSARF
ncbi:hypothetical protein [Sandaracinus amylolyticus]|nr:hypothetical protein [Sandaracinus amylolyticus]